MTVIAKNQTAGALSMNQLPIPGNEIPASGQVTLTDYATLNEIQDDVELLAHINAGDCILNDGAQDLSQAASLAMASTVAATQSGTALTETIVDAKGDLLVATAADTITRLPIGTNRQILRADSTSTEGMTWVSEDQAVYADYYDAGSTTVGSSPTTLGLDTARQSNALFVLQSDTVTVQAGGAGTYFIRYDVTFRETDSSNREIECWMEVNGTEVTATRSVFSHWDEHGIVTDDTAGRSVILTLAVGDVIRLRGDVTNGSSGYNTDKGGVSLQIMSIGSNGPAGPQGPAGSGSSITVEEDGNVVSGGPHSTLNFVGMSATDAGSGTADVKNVYGSEYQSVVDRTYRSTTGTSWYEAHSLTTSSLPAGTYRIEWNYVWSYNATNSDFRCRVQLDNSIELYEQTSGGAGAYNRHQQEPKDRDGSGDGGTNQRYVTSFWADKTLSAGTHQVDIDISGSSGSVIASIHLSSIAVYRVA